MLLLLDCHLQISVTFGYGSGKKKDLEDFRECLPFNESSLSMSILLQVAETQEPCQKTKLAGIYSSW